MCQPACFFRVAFSNARDRSALAGGCFNRSSRCSAIPHEGHGPGWCAGTATAQHTRAQMASKEPLPQTSFLGWSEVKMKANKLQEQRSFLRVTWRYSALLRKACAVCSSLEGQAADCRTLIAVTLIVSHTEGGIADTVLFANRVECY